MIDRSQQVLLEAIKASLFNVKPTYPDDTDWDEVIKEAKAQAVIGLISPVIPVHDEISDQSIAYYIRLLHEQDKLLKLLEINNISCVILKGCAAAAYYPKPYLRGMGDVDILISPNQFYKAMDVLESNGYEYLHGKDENGKPIENARHVSYKKNGIEFELHHHFSSVGFNIDDLLEKAIDRKEYREINGYRFPVLPEIESGLVLLGHMYHHLKNDNLGLRQIIDWEMYYHSVMNDEKWKQDFSPIAKRCGLFELAVNVNRMCEKHLALSKKKKEIASKHKNGEIEDIRADKLLENLLTNGNFGVKKKPSSSNVESGKDIRDVMGIIKDKGLYSYFRDNGLAHSKLCQKHPTLTLVAFIFGFFRFLARGSIKIIKTGNYIEQIRYLRERNKHDKDLGLRTKENKKW